jgi:hypothetical protein
LSCLVQKSDGTLKIASQVRHSRFEQQRCPPKSLSGKLWGGVMTSHEGNKDCLAWVVNVRFPRRVQSVVATLHSYDEMEGQR